MKALKVHLQNARHISTYNNTALDWIISDLNFDCGTYISLSSYHFPIWARLASVINWTFSIYLYNILYNNKFRFFNRIPCKIYILNSLYHHNINSLIRWFILLKHVKYNICSCQQHFHSISLLYRYESTCHPLKILYAKYAIKHTSESTHYWGTWKHFLIM